MEISEQHDPQVVQVVASCVGSLIGERPRLPHTPRAVNREVVREVGPVAIGRLGSRVELANSLQLIGRGPPCVGLNLACGVVDGDAWVTPPITSMLAQVGARLQCPVGSRDNDDEAHRKSAAMALPCASGKTSEPRSAVASAGGRGIGLSGLRG